MKIKDQTKKLAVACSKHRFEAVYETDEASSKHCFEVTDRTDEVSNIYICQAEDGLVWRDFWKVLTPTDKPDDSKNYPTR